MSNFYGEWEKFLKSKNPYLNPVEALNQYNEGKERQDAFAWKVLGKIQNELPSTSPSYVPGSPIVFLTDKDIKLALGVINQCIVPVGDKFFLAHPESGQLFFEENNSLVLLTVDAVTDHFKYEIGIFMSMCMKNTGETLINEANILMRTNNRLIRMSKSPLSGYAAKKAIGEGLTTSGKGLYKVCKFLGSRVVGIVFDLFIDVQPASPPNITDEDFQRRVFKQIGYLCEGKLINHQQTILKQ